MTEYIKNQLIKLCNHPEWFNDMLISLDNNPEEPHTAKSEIIAAVNGVYAPDMVFNTIEEIQEYFEYVHLESQEINNNHLHSEHIRLQIREILQIPLRDITIIDIISLP
jgi:hypothetical protein